MPLFTPANDFDVERRQEFHRAGAVMRAHGRRKRWLPLRRWATVRGSKRCELETLFAANRRLFKAYVLREQLDRLWTCKTRRGALEFLEGWVKALRWQRLPEMERLGDSLFRQVEGIYAAFNRRDLMLKCALPSVWQSTACV
jgi:transposase